MITTVNAKTKAIEIADVNLRASRVLKKLARRDSKSEGHE